MIPYMYKNPNGITSRDMSKDASGERRMVITTDRVTQAILSTRLFLSLPMSNTCTGNITHGINNNALGLYIKPTQTVLAM